MIDYDRNFDPNEGLIKEAKEIITNMEFIISQFQDELTDFNVINVNLDTVVEKATKLKSKIKKDTERRNKIDGFFG